MNDFTPNTKLVDIFRLPSQTRLILIVSIGGLMSALGVLSFLGILIDLPFNMLVTHFLDVPQSIILEHAYLIFIASQFVFIPLISLIQVLLKPAYIKLRYRTYDLGKIDNTTKTYISTLFKQIGITRPPHIIVSDRNVATQVFGGFSHHLLISKQVLSNISDNEKKYLLMHEGAHILNKDILNTEYLFATTRSLFFSTMLSILARVWFVLIDKDLANVILQRKGLQGLFTSYQFDLRISFFQTPIVVLLFFLFIYSKIFQDILWLFRERLADLRVQSFSNDLGDFFVLVGRGTNKPSWIANILQLGQERWTRHEALLDPYRLARPNFAFIFLVGILYGIFFIYLLLAFSSVFLGDHIMYYDALQNTPEIANYIGPIYTTIITTISVNNITLLISRIVYLLIGLILFWVVVTSLSYTITTKINKRNFWKVFFYFFSSSIAMLGGNMVGATVFGLGILLTRTDFTDVSFFALNISLIHPIVILFVAFPIFFFSYVFQDGILRAYYIVPIIKRHTAFFTIYLPLILGCLVWGWQFLVPTITGFNIGSNLAQENNTGNILTYFSLLLTDVIPQARSNLEGWYSGAASRLITLLLFFVVVYSLLNILRRCYCCGNKTATDFSIEDQCKVCGYPLGSWLAYGTLPEPNLFLREKGLVKKPFTSKLAIKYFLIELLEMLNMFIILLSLPVLGWLWIRGIINFLVVIILVVVIFIVVSSIISFTEKASKAE